MFLTPPVGIFYVFWPGFTGMQCCLVSSYLSVAKMLVPSGILICKLLLRCNHFCTCIKQIKQIKIDTFHPFFFSQNSIEGSFFYSICYGSKVFHYWKVSKIICQTISIKWFLLSLFAVSWLYVFNVWSSGSFSWMHWSQTMFLKLGALSWS